jgi:hypothetical protein
LCSKNPILFIGAYRWIRLFKSYSSVTSVLMYMLKLKK